MILTLPPFWSRGEPPGTGAGGKNGAATAT
jgi:hypothetical protein